MTHKKYKWILKKSKRIFFNKILFSIKIPAQPIPKICFKKYWFRLRIIEKKCVNTCFSRFFRPFLSKFLIFLETVFSTEIPFNCDRIDDYWRKNWTKRKKAKMCNLLINYLRYRNSNQTIVYIDFNWRFKQSNCLFLKFFLCHLTPFMMNFMLRKDTCLDALILINMTKCGLQSY